METKTRNNVRRPKDSILKETAAILLSFLLCHLALVTFLMTSLMTFTFQPQKKKPKPLINTRNFGLLQVAEGRLELSTPRV